jgi:hypothetical protein
LRTKRLTEQASAAFGPGSITIYWLRFLSGEKLLVAALLIVHAGLLLYSSHKTFATRNEVAHIPAGISCWTTESFSLYRVNPPLWRMLAVLPVFAARPNTECIEFSDAPGVREEWVVARRFADANALNYRELIFLARLVGVGWSVLGGLLVYRWAGQLYGKLAALLGLCLWCFEPNLIAHSQLMTPDMPATVAALASTYAFWRYLRTGEWDLAIIAGLLLGVAQLTKFTLLVLYPVWLVLGLVHSLDRTNMSFRSVPVGTRLGQGATMLVTSLIVLNAGYAFNGTGTRLGDFQFCNRLFIGAELAPAEKSGNHLGNRFKGTWVGDLPVLVPADYLTGIDLQRRDFEGRVGPSFLAGEWRQNGWWYYYIYALALKIPLGVSCLALWGAALFLTRRSERSFADELTIWLPAFALLVLVSSQTGFNHHMRYVLPMFPFVLVGSSKLGALFLADTWKRGTLVAGLLGWSVLSSLWIYPHSLSYFNELAGGPDNGHRYLLDSNIDWGQDLYYLKDWADAHPEAAPLSLAYFNFIDYRVCGEEFSAVPEDPMPNPSARPGGELRIGPHPGYFALDLFSLNMGPFEYFKLFKPVAKAGYSIFIYRIDLTEANLARQQLGLPLLTDDPKVSEIR